MTASQERGQQEAGGPGVWLDMSRYPDTDPDTVLSSDDHSLLTTSLAVDDSELPDSVWEHMLAVVVGDPDAGDVDATGDASAEPQSDGDDWADGADGVVTEHHAEDPADDPAAHDPGHDAAHDPALHDDGSGDGGWV